MPPASPHLRGAGQAALQLLLIEPSEAQAAHCVQCLQQEELPAQCTRVVTRTEVDAAMAGGPWDGVLCDGRLRHWPGAAIVRYVRSCLGPDVPVIVLHPQATAEEAIECVRCGANDVWLSPRLHKLPAVILREHLKRLEADEERRERSSIEVQLRHAGRMEAVGMLAAGIAHEINTPLQYVESSLYIIETALKRIGALREGGDVEHASADTVATLTRFSSRLPTAVHNARKGVERVKEIVRAMRDYSHPGQQERTQLDFNRCVMDAVLLSKSEWKYVAQLELELAQDMPVIYGHPSDLVRAITSLVVNAAQAIEERLRQDAGPGQTHIGMGSITIRSLVHPDYIELQVQDSGAGIPVEIRDRLFDPFFTTKEVGRGTGQGLYFVHQIVVSGHLGRVRYESDVGQGTAFFIELPIDPSKSIRSVIPPAAPP